MTDGEIAEKVASIFDLRPAAIIERFGLKYPVFSETAAYGHMGRTPATKEVEVCYNGKQEIIKVEFFAWEKLDYVDKIKKAFSLKNPAKVSEKAEA